MNYVNLNNVDVLPERFMYNTSLQYLKCSKCVKMTGDFGFNKHLETIDFDELDTLDLGSLSSFENLVNIRMPKLKTLQL